MDHDDPRVGPLSGPQTAATAPARRGLGLTVIAAVGLFTFCGMCIASAASVTTSTDSLAAANVAVPRCSTAGILVFELVSGAGAGTVNSVVLQNVDSACAGGTLTLNVNSGGGTTVSASATVPAGGGQMILTITPAPTIVVGNEVDFVIVGP